MNQRGVDSGQRRAWLAVTLAAVALWATACGSDDESAATTGPATTSLAATVVDTPAPSSTPASSAPADQYPVEIDQPLGKVVVDAAPSRLVTLGSAETDIAVALGVVPVGVVAVPITADSVTPWLADALGGQEPPTRIDVTGGVPLEQVAALHPDVIVATSLASVDADYAALSKIAPVVAYQHGLFADSWQDQTRTIGQVLGRSAAAEQLVAAVEGKIRTTASDHPGFAGATVSTGIVVDPTSINVVQSTQDFTGQLLHDLGLSIPTAVQALPPGSLPGIATVSLEQLDTIDADVLLISYLSPDAQDAFEAAPVFQSLGAVTKGHYFPMDLATGTALRVPSPLSIPYALDQLAPKLTDALG